MYHNTLKNETDKAKQKGIAFWKQESVYIEVLPINVYPLGKQMTIKTCLVYRGFEEDQNT